MKIQGIQARSVLALALVLPACGPAPASEQPDYKGGLVPLAPGRTPYAIDPGAPVAPVSIGPSWLVYLADEAASGAADVNGDGDAIDRVAVAFDLRRRMATPLRAARAAWLVGDEIYLSCDEVQDGRDWSNDGANDDLVLLHWSAARASVTFVAAMDESATLVAGGKLYFVDADDALPLIAGATKLHWVSPDAPIVPVRLLASSADSGSAPRPLCQDAGLLFLLQDETAEVRDLNGDGDSTDRRVLALLDVEDPAARIGNTALALGAEPPVRAQRLLDGDRLVAFLVDEAAQGSTNLNDSSVELLPVRCAGLEDTDTDDQVLHFLFHRPWSQDSQLFPPANAGLAGTARVMVQESADGARHLVATIAREADEGGCSLNGDADLDDLVLRWVEVTPGAVLFRPDPSRSLALHDAPGGAHGVAEVEGRFVAILSEPEDGQDLSGDLAIDKELLAWIDPFVSIGDPQEWTFSTLRRSAGWMGLHPERSRLLFSVLENPQHPSRNHDDDFDDSFARFGRFETGDLDWNGYLYSASRSNPGQVLVGDQAYFRADEADERLDINEDGDKLDQVLVCHAMFPLRRMYYVDTSNDLPMPAVFGGEGNTVAYLADEAMSGRDGNGDGDASDLVLRTLSVH